MDQTTSDDRLQCHRSKTIERTPYATKKKSPESVLVRQHARTAHSCNQLIYSGELNAHLLRTCLFWGAHNFCGNNRVCGYLHSSAQFTRRTAFSFVVWLHCPALNNWIERERRYWGAISFSFFPPHKLDSHHMKFYNKHGSFHRSFSYRPADQRM